MKPIEQLRALVQAQELATAIREARAIVDGAPARIDQIEERFRERNAEYVAVRDRHEDVAQDQKTRQARVQELEELRDKYKQSLMQVSNQREYAAVLKEIDTVESEISGHEEAILKDMEELESLTGELKGHEEHIGRERKAVEKETAEIRQAADDAAQRIDALETRRREVESGLPGPLVEGTRALEQNRQGVFLAQVDNDGTCTACFVRVRPQVIQEIRRGAKIHNCGSCKRYLFHEAILANGEESSDASSPASASTASSASSASVKTSHTASSSVP